MGSKSPYIKEFKMIKKQKLFILVIFTIFILIVFAFRNVFLKIFSLLLLASIEAYLVFPFIKFFEKRMPRKFAIIVGFSILAVILSETVILLIPVFISQVKSFIEFLPQYITEVKVLFNRFPFAEGIFDNLKFNEGVSNKITDLLSFLTPDALMSFISSTFLVPVIVYYILNEREKIREICLFLLPGKMRTPSIYIFKDINRQLKDYVIGELIIILAVSFLMSAVLGFFGFKYWLLLGILMGVFNVIPYIGPVLGSLPILFTAFLQDKIILALILILTVQQIDNLIIHPRIISNSVKIHPVIVLLCVVAGNAFGNIWGMVLAVPLFIIFRILFKEFYKYFSERKRNFLQFNKI